MFSSGTSKSIIYFDVNKTNVYISVFQSVHSIYFTVHKTFDDW